MGDALIEPAHPRYPEIAPARRATTPRGRFGQRRKGTRWQL